MFENLGWEGGLLAVFIIMIQCLHTSIMVTVLLEYIDIFVMPIRLLALMTITTFNVGAQT